MRAVCVWTEGAKSVTLTAFMTYPGEAAPELERVCRGLGGGRG